MPPKGPKLPVRDAAKEEAWKKELMERIQGFLEGEARGIAKEADGYRVITWKQLKDVYGFETPAKGFKLVGEVTRRDDQYWQQSKHVQVKDASGEEHAVFFYFEDPALFDDLRVGSSIEILNPKYHFFMDRQEGIRVQERSSVGKVEKKALICEAKRIEYARFNRSRGNERFQDGVFDDAARLYEAALSHTEATFKDKPHLQAEANTIAATCYLNIAACMIGRKEYERVVDVCERSLRLMPPDDAGWSEKRAKAYFRMGQACMAQRHLSFAVRYLKDAQRHAPEDGKIAEMLFKATEELNAIPESEKQIFGKALEAEKAKKFGVKKSLLGASPDATMASDPTFHDLGLTLGLKRNMLYRCNGTALRWTVHDRRLLFDELGVKTIISLRAPFKRSFVDWGFEYFTIRSSCPVQLTSAVSLAAGEDTEQSSPAHADQRVWVDDNFGKLMIARLLGSAAQLIVVVLWALLSLLPPLLHRWNSYFASRVRSKGAVTVDDGVALVTSSSTGPQLAACLKHRENYPILFVCNDRSEDANGGRWRTLKGARSENCGGFMQTAPDATLLLLLSLAIPTVTRTAAMREFRPDLSDCIVDILVAAQKRFGLQEEPTTRSQASSPEAQLQSACRRALGVEDSSLWSDVASIVSRQ